MTAERAYAEVQRLTRQRARNFAYGIMVLPREKRRAIAAPMPRLAPVTMATRPCNGAPVLTPCDVPRTRFAVQMRGASAMLV